MGSSSETQLQVGDNLNYLSQRFDWGLGFSVQTNLFEKFTPFLDINIDKNRFQIKLVAPNLT